MRFKKMRLGTIALVTTAGCLQIGLALLAQAPAPQAGGQRGATGRGGAFNQAADPRVQNRTYRFQDANEAWNEFPPSEDCTRL